MYAHRNDERCVVLQKYHKKIVYFISLKVLKKKGIIDYINECNQHNFDTISNVILCYKYIAFQSAICCELCA